MFQVWYRNLCVWLKHLRASLIGNLGQPVLFLVAMGYGLGKSVPEIEGLSYLQFIAPGLVASAVMYSSAFEATYGAYTRLSTQGTFEAILMTPITIHELALGEMLWGATKGMIAGIIMLLALPFFGVMPSMSSLLMIPLLFVEGLIFSAFGLIMTAVATNYDFFNYFTSLIITPFFLFSGIFFSLDAVAIPFRYLLEILPLSQVVVLSRMFCYGKISSLHDVFFGIGVIFMFATVSISLASWLLRRRMIR